MSGLCIAPACGRAAVAKGLCHRCYKRKAANGTPTLPPRLTTMDRLERSIHRTEGGCWEWTAYVAKCGYGQVYHAGRMRPAHRVMYELVRGPLQTDEVIDHICRNRACVNPEHLRPATRAENASYSAPAAGASSRFKGVVVQSAGFIQAYIGDNGSTIYLGSFRSEADAARAYDQAAIERHGDFALTNAALGLL